MPRAIADSDDEEDELSSDHNIDKAQINAGQLSNGQGDHATQGLDDGNKKSTGSTESLRQRITSAEQKLGTNSAPDTVDYLSSISPATMANKRRRASLASSQPVNNTQRIVKRSKTTKTCSAKRHNDADGDESFKRLVEDDYYSRTSQTGRFTEHPGTASPTGLPSGSIRDEFRDHEPHVMFRDSGTTIADDSSTQQRLLEEALGKKGGLPTSTKTHSTCSEQEAHSLSWSPSQQDRATRRHRSQTQAPAETVDANEATVAANSKQHEGLHVSNASLTATKRSPQAKDGSPFGATEESAQVRQPAKIALSPAVEIRLDTNDTPNSAVKATISTTKAQRGRKRKAETNDDDEPLISDDSPVGLPQEQYKPRPSRRRATQIPEETTDFSMRPERAAKLRRTKTSHATAGSIVADAAPEDSVTIAPSRMTSPKRAKATEGAGTGKAQEASPSIRVQSLQDRVQAKIEDGKSEAERMELQHAQEPPASQRSAVAKEEDDIVVQPSALAQATRSTAKSKRSKTTIFEDHLEFTGSQRAPNLSQQQANRKLALQDVHNEAKSSQRKRKSMVVTDDGEDDEVFQDREEDVQEDPVPKERGRGRPPKSTAKIQPELVDNTTEDSREKLEQGKTQSVPTDPPLEKIRKGKSTKITVESTQDDESKTKEEESPTNHKRAAPASRSVGGGTVDPSNTSSAASYNVSTFPTPSPEKHNTPQKGKPSPTSHSPIKSTSSMPHRVGLSNRHRIPSLLKFVKPKR